MAKLGKCPQCPAGSRDMLLIGGKCDFHHKGGGAVERNDAPSKLKAIAANNKTLKAWYDEQIKQIPVKCENCGKKIGKLPEGMSKRTNVPHILPKATIKSVATHDLNRWFGCWQCHTDYDEKSPSEVEKMPVMKLCKARYKVFAHLIPETEQRHIPEYFK